MPDTSNIIALPQHLVNRIAAGEVVERPASIVKELLENALDAAATEITVELEDGGKKLIRITDNGSGIASNQLALAVAPHATSKIADEDDLFAIGTFGFRGEALASIASISQLEIVSRPAHAVEGTRLLVAGGAAEPPGPAATAPGTAVTVRNLFYNTPARRKFLRTTNTELGHATEQFTRIALAHTNVRMTLIHNGRNLQQLHADQSLPQRIAGLFSPELAANMFPIHRRDDDAEITGLIAAPSAARTGSQWLYVFLNGRYIRDRFINHAIREAYRGMLEANRQPIVFLFLKIPPDAVDVNVHPAKIEVRFADSNRIHSQVLAAIRDRLLSTDLSVAVDQGDLEDRSAAGPPGPADQARSETEDERRQRVRQAMADFFKSAPRSSSSQFAQSPPHRPSSSAPSHAAAAARADHSPPQGLPPNAAHPPGSLPGETLSPPGAPGDAAAQPSPATPAPATPAQALRELAGRPFLQVHNSYLVGEADDGLVIIDQHALHERIIYEQLSEQLQHGPLPSQRSLIPETVDVTAEHIAVLDDAAELLGELGIVVEQFGPTTVAVQAFPSLLAKVSPGAFVGELLDLFVSQVGQTSREELLHHLLDMMACKAAVKAGDPLTDGEIQDLLAQRSLTQRTGTCPHGRPTTIRLSLGQLEKQFKRS